MLHSSYIVFVLRLPAYLSIYLVPGNPYGRVSAEFSIALHLVILFYSNRPFKKGAGAFYSPYSIFQLQPPFPQTPL